MKGMMISVLLFSLCTTLPGSAQEKLWSLQDCIDYALDQNIQVKKSKIALEESKENTLQTRAQLFPSLAFSSGQNLVNHPKTIDTDKNSYTGTYGFSSSMSLYRGGELRLNLKQQQLQDKIQELYIQEAENNIEIAITESYLQVLYAAEAVEINKKTVEISAAQCDRARELYAAGDIAQSDLAQLISQYSADKYQLVVAQATLEEKKLELKQLLELDISAVVELNVPAIQESDVLQQLPSKEVIYAAALDFMPEIKSSQLAVNSAEYDVAVARSGYLPSLDLTAGIGSTHSSGSDYSFSRQMKNNFNESIGLTLSVPIYSNRKNKSAVKIARLKVENADLDYLNTQKDLLKTVETVYLDAVSSQDRYRSAMESMNAARQSFALVQEQFNLGMKNTLEMLTEKNNLLIAQQEIIQAKYMAILSQQLLNFYQGKGIQLGMQTESYR
ncbi:TolC family protein [Odoribacter laneus]|uniref:TolC family protein n=1 Tax=Odoribacter laneus TaxID=626933 RepID=UPI00033CEC32|nr:TolC family protein [Odoribacter laneus]CCZ80522.1 putative uncharacterized protein [Odoribacter laneus CAG:561]